MSDTQVLFLIVLAPFALYGVCRIIFSAYFRSKADYLRRFFRAQPDQKTRSRRSG